MFRNSHKQDGIVRINLTLNRVRVTIFYCGKAIIIITYSECVSVALVIHHTKRMIRIILSSVACLALPCLFTLSHKRHDCWEKKKLFNINCTF
jgi:hypothetical protein